MMHPLNLFICTHAFFQIHQNVATTTRRNSIMHSFQCTMLTFKLLVPTRFANLDMHVNSFTSAKRQVLSVNIINSKSATSIYGRITYDTFFQVVINPNLEYSNVILKPSMVKVCGKLYLIVCKHGGLKIFFNQYSRAI